MASTIPTVLRYSPPISSPVDSPSTTEHIYNLTQTPAFVHIKQTQDIIEAKIDAKLYQLPCKDTVSSLLFMRRFISREKTKQFKFDTSSRLYWGTITKNHLEESNDYLKTISDAVDHLDDHDSCNALINYMTSKGYVLPK